MRRLRKEQSFLISFIAFTLCGCGPTIQEAAKRISKIPVGISRYEFRQRVGDMYPHQVLKSWRDYGYPPPRVPSPRLMEWDISSVQHHNEIGDFVMAFPPGLLTNGTIAFFEISGIGGWQAATGHGVIAFYYDTNLNYIGFMAESQEKVKTVK